MKFFKSVSRYFYVVIALFIVFVGLYDVAVYNSGTSETFNPVISENMGKTEEKIVLPIIMYHSLLKDKKYQGKYVLSPDLFENDLKYLSENGYTTIVVQDLIDHYENGTPLPEKPVMLTFDDGYYNNYLYAYPLLQKYNSKAVISIIGIHTEKFSATQDVSANYSHITWDEITEMTKSGLVEIQNHSYNMHSLDKGRKGSKKKSSETNAEYCEILKSDIEKLQKLLYENCNITPTAFTYPFGAISDASVDVIKELGFKASFTCLQKINILESEDDLYLLNRYLRTEDSSEKFFSSLDLDKYYEEVKN